MRKYFNTTGLCYHQEHYMVDIEGRLDATKKLVDRGEYFVINRARQYGKTTTINLMIDKLSSQYTIFSISFEGIEDEVYGSAVAFCQNFYSLLCDEFSYHTVEGIPDEIWEECEKKSRERRTGREWAVCRNLFPECVGTHSGRLYW